MSTRTTAPRLFAAIASATAVVVAASAAAPAARGAAYTIADLGTANGQPIFGAGIDNTGRVLANYIGTNAYTQSGILTNGTLTPIPGLGGRSLVPQGFSPAGAYATGYGRTAGTDPTAANPFNAFLYNGSSGTTTDIPPWAGPTPTPLP